LHDKLSRAFKHHLNLRPTIFSIGSRAAMQHVVMPSNRAKDAASCTVIFAVQQIHGGAHGMLN
jgi:hypothetical protein